MTTLVLVRHGRTTANASGCLAGWSPGVFLDELGQEQATAVAGRLAATNLAAVVVSPLDRTQQTADAICAAQASDVRRVTDDAIGECQYGEWTGQQLSDLAKNPLWKQVQSHPSAVTFPGGESMAAMQHRAVAAVRHWNAELGSDAVYAMVSHGDVIKAILADALGMHLDHFQRIACDPCSLSVVHWTPDRPFVLRMNDTGTGPIALRPPKRKGRKRSDAAVGGGSG